MKQEVQIRGKRIFIIIAVLFIAIYIILRKRKYECFYDGISEYENRYRGNVPFLLLAVGLFQYCRQNEMSFSHMLQYVREKLAE
ncbi:autophagy-related protein 27 [Bacillus cereus group sp. BfR-BA-01309]|uniref:autophagy-related protein 27 n=1 Tax=Bacillus cereus group sp. BfR-BA-01309 TaxID=2920286 RepID=UPI001F562DC2|nr:autophagy-related protein 27 [Bacillus cereus group sp. BfR-BA-01309]